MVEQPVSRGIDLNHLGRWIGRSETSTDCVVATPLRALAAALDYEKLADRPGDPIPPCWHWLFFLPLHFQSEMGPDGHERRGGFLPPVPLPRRMWAGGRLEWSRPLRVGLPLTRTSRVVDVKVKDGRTGPLVFVAVRHEIADQAGPCLIEEQDLVYRQLPRPGEAVPPPTPASMARDWMREITPDAVLLFRYSALTFNAHRIHYDRRYAIEVEGYPGLVVHGPLIAMLLLDLLRRNMPTAYVLRFTFRAIKPTFDVAPFRVCGRAESDKSVRLWAEQADGSLAMDATAALT